MSNPTVTVRRIPSSVIWQFQLFVGLVTAVLGVLLTFHPTGTLSFVMVILGVGIVLGGIMSLLGALDPADEHRVLRTVGGIVQLIVGVMLLRHLHWGIAVIGLLIGISWIIQGIGVLLSGFLGGASKSRIWTILFGLLSLVAGIVVVASPLHSTKTLAILLGIWFMILGVVEAIGGLVLRSALKQAS